MFDGRVRLILSVDLRKYSTHNYRGQRDAQNRLQRLIGYALRRCGVTKVRVQRQEQGDGHLVVFPAWAGDPEVVAALILGLRDGLYHLNLVTGAFGRMRMRAALTQSPLRRSANGYLGDGIVRVNRMLDAPGVRAALEDAEDSDLVVALTPQLHEEIVALHPPGLTADDFRLVELSVPEKNYATEAWLHVPKAGPAPDPHPGGVRWGETATRRALSDYALPSIAVVQIAIAARHVVAASSKVQEWTVAEPDHTTGHHRSHGHSSKVNDDTFDRRPDHHASHPDHDTAHHGAQHHLDPHHPEPHHQHASPQDLHHRHDLHHNGPGGQSHDGHHHGDQHPLPTTPHDNLDQAPGHHDWWHSSWHTHDPGAGHSPHS
ncbi:hypothetical protein [Umezawaea tangerina]|uniref:Uncharacterized protein n=1 Tax=Umezawaea tangerina TaxID=84725 RepID=A0A2T0T6P0_9PSEU|nr:hypothetical protein [Umezawaea tangerina]PRY41329.1 hypothetical protein CLV43_10587 [Umezawaea tangerina]